MKRELQVAYALKLHEYMGTFLAADDDKWPEECRIYWLRGMCIRLQQNWRQMSETKCGRWVGYIQGVLIARGLSTVEREKKVYKQFKRDFVHAYNERADQPVLRDQGGHAPAAGGPLGASGDDEHAPGAERRQADDAGGV